MWVVNPSEEEEKGLINRRDTVPAATSVGQLALEAWLPGVTTPRELCRAGVDPMDGVMKVKGSLAQRGPHQHSLEESLLLLL